jgi:hypothetical protein
MKLGGTPAFSLDYPSARVIWAVRDAIFKTERVKQKGVVCDYQEVKVDAGVTDKRLLVIESEFASTLKVMAREGNTLSATIRQAWDSGDLRILNKNSPARSSRQDPGSTERRTSRNDRERD